MFCSIIFNFFSYHILYIFELCLHRKVLPICSLFPILIVFFIISDRSHTLNPKNAQQVTTSLSECHTSWSGIFVVPMPYNIIMS